MLSAKEEGALVGGRMLGVRYAGGRVLVRIQDLLLLLADEEEGFSARWAAGNVDKLACSYSYRTWGF